jgi:sirohydrochlorin ferrochelatase
MTVLLAAGPPVPGSGAGGPALVAVAHGSRDPRSAATVRALAGQVRALRPDLDVREAFLDLSEPALPAVLDEVAAAGHRHAVVVPLLLGRAFHARVDLPGLVAAARRRHPGLELSVAEVLGADRALLDAATDRLAEVTGPGPDPGLGVVLAATGTRHAEANAVVHRLAAGLAARRGWRGCHAAFATCAPSVDEALARLRAEGAERLAVASWFLAPGLLPERVRAAALAAEPDVRIAGPLGAHPGVARVVLHRYRTAAAALPTAA